MPNPRHSSSAASRSVGRYLTSAFGRITCRYSYSSSKQQNNNARESALCALAYPLSNRLAFPRRGAVVAVRFRARLREKLDANRDATLEIHPFPLKTGWNESLCRVVERWTDRCTAESRKSPRSTFRYRVVSAPAKVPPVSWSPSRIALHNFKLKFGRGRNSSLFSHFDRIFVSRQDGGGGCVSSERFITRRSYRYASPLARTPLSLHFSVKAD